MRLTFTPLAEQDLETIADDIAADNPVHVGRNSEAYSAECPCSRPHAAGYAALTALRAYPPYGHTRQT